MQTKTVRMVTTIVAVASLAIGVEAAVTMQNGKKATPIAGRWSMIVEGTPHGKMTMALVLTQQGKDITGTFESPHGDMPVTGEFVDGALTLTTSGGESPITFKAKLKEDATLVGFLSSAMGEMTWTAERNGS